METKRWSDFVENTINQKSYELARDVLKVLKLPINHEIRFPVLIRLQTSVSQANNARNKLAFVQRVAVTLNSLPRVDSLGRGGGRGTRRLKINGIITRGKHRR